MDPRPFPTMNWAKQAVAKDHSLSAGLVWCRECGRRRSVDSAKCLRQGWPKCCGATMSLCPPISKVEKLMDDLHDKASAR